MPFNKLVRPGTPPPPFVFAESPITITADAVSTTSTPAVAGHGEVWQAQASDPIQIRPEPIGK